MRNFDFGFTVRSAMFAIAIAWSLGAEQSFAQSRRFGYPTPQNVTPKPQPGAPQPVQAAQPPVVAPPEPDQAAVTAQSNDQFRQVLDRAIEITSKRYLTANSHSPWQIFHSILALRQQTLVRLGNEKVNAIEWLSTAEPQFDNQPWLLLTPHGAKFHPYTKKYYFEGHPAQFLALLSQSNLPLDYKFHVQGKVVTLNDLINNTKQEVNTNEEITWVLWVLQHYLKSDASWVNQANEPWSIEKLVQIESNSPVVGAPCGGNHRLFALTRARDKYIQSGGKLRGAWLQADQKIKQHIEIARSLQNADGSFSADSYKGPLHTNDVNLRFNTTGHTMEFLSIGLPTDRLHEPWVRNAVWVLSRELMIHQNSQIDAGPLFHTLDALILYRDRIRPKPTSPSPERPVDPPQMARPVPDSTLGLKLKSTPDPIAVLEVAKPIPETKEIASIPLEPTLTQPHSRTVAAPVADLPTDSIAKSATQKPAKLSQPQKTVDPKSLSMKTEPSKLRRGASPPNIPKIDPSQLANVGQVVPQKAGERRLNPEKSRGPQKNSAPALLPEHSATPISELEVADDDSLSRLIPPKLELPSNDEKNHVNGEMIVPNSTEIAASASEPVSAIHPLTESEPVSALEPANQSVPMIATEPKDEKRE